MRDAVLLLSGGLDSATVAGILHSKGIGFRALTIEYGQRHSRELEAAKAIAGHYGAVEHLIFKMNMKDIGGSALLEEKREIPEKGEGIPSTYVPARNTVFLALALSMAEARDADEIYIGANAVDYSGYPDCRPEYIEEFNRLSSLATKRGVEGKPIRIVAPLTGMSKAEIVRRGAALGVPYGLTWSCYRGGAAACGRCDSCRYRLKGFREAGIEDPIAYEDQ
ncbi:MAG: 7-cyano-7-deazaguanine synthase QueC [Methanomassiliicoccales archaeon]